MTKLCVVPTAERPLEEALGLSATLVDASRTHGAAVLATSLVTSSVSVLGARQSRSSAAVGVVLRRLTLGTTAHVMGRVLWHALALPRPDALAPDGTPFNVLNRNLRGFISGYTSGGLTASYGGREFLTIGRRPCALVGYDVYADGAVLVEVMLGLEAPVLASVLRPRGAAQANGPAAYVEVARRPLDAAELGQRVEAGFARRFNCSCVHLKLDPVAGARRVAGDPSAAEGRELGARAVPLGAIRAMIYGTRFRVEGEILGSSAGLERFETLVNARLEARAPLGPDLLDVFAELPLEAARTEDLFALAALAERSAREREPSAERIPTTARTVDPQ